MILVDTSVRIAHLRGAERTLAARLDAGAVFMHPFVVAELACGTLRNRAELLDLLRALPQAPKATDEETLVYIERHRLFGRGIDYIDVHLLASTTLAGTARLWTDDVRLAAVAGDLELAYPNR